MSSSNTTKVEKAERGRKRTSSILATLSLILVSKQLSKNEGAAMLVLSLVVKSAIASTSNSLMPAATNAAFVVFFVHSAEPLKQKELLRSRLKMGSYVHEKFANIKVVASLDSATLRYT